MKIVVIGGRDYTEKEIVFKTLDALHKKRCITELTHGACGWDGDRPSTHLVENLRGADALADEWALEHQVALVRMPAYWKTEGKRAGPSRNRRMISLQPVALIAFPGGSGTQNCIFEADFATPKVPILRVLPNGKAFWL